MHPLGLSRWGFQWPKGIPKAKPLQTCHDCWLHSGCIHPVIVRDHKWKVEIKNPYASQRRSTIITICWWFQLSTQLKNMRTSYWIKSFAWNFWVKYQGKISDTHHRSIRFSKNPSFFEVFFQSQNDIKQKNTLQGINISHLGKRKIIFKYALSGGYVSSLEGTSWTQNPKTDVQQHLAHLRFFRWSFCKTLT